MESIRPKIINMDTASPAGLQFAHDSNLVDSNLIDVLVSNYFLAGSALFTTHHSGRTFSVLRHPIELAASLFYYRCIATWEPSYRADWKDRYPTFGDYVSTKFYMGNWMVRQLTGTMADVELTQDHLEHAKLVLRTKVFVGIASEMDETVRQLEAYFGWREGNKSNRMCVDKFLHGKPSNTNAHPSVVKDGDEWNVAAEKEKWDLSLYYYALELFAAQQRRFPPLEGVGTGDGEDEVVV